MNYIYDFLGWIMNGCYGLVKDYGLAILIFTIITKIVMIPLSVWTHYNSITMIKIQPDVNFIKAKYYGQSDQIADESSKLYKEKGYRPMVSIIPTLIQLILLMGVVGVIKLGIENPEINMVSLGINLAEVPSKVGVRLLYSPILAGLSSWLMCWTQNKSNVLQSEQSNANKYGMMVFSIALSLYLGWFVPIGTAWYWVCSNLLSIVQMYILNWCIKPSKYVDYEALEKSRQALAELEGIGKTKVKKDSAYYANKKREKADYKKFFSVVNKHLVFYSESNGFYKYFKGYIEYILKNTNITIHYITSDPEDKIFELEKQNNKIRAYYIGENKLITLMMKMEADVVIMTMPDLENFHIKRSYIRKDIEYIFVSHGMGSNNLTFRKGALDHFDTVFCVGELDKIENIELEEKNSLPKKNLVEVGYPLIDDMAEEYKNLSRESNDRKLIMIAPSWQKDNIIDGCLEKLLEELKKTDYDIIVRPHPQEVRLKREHIESIKEKYDSDRITVTTDFSSHNPVMEADLLITDWSDISMEYAYTTKKPVLFVNTPMKVMNPDWQEIEAVPMNLQVRDNLGRAIELSQLDNLVETVNEMLSSSDNFKAKIEDFENKNLYNHGNSAEVGAKYIISAIQKKIKEKKTT